ncbi:MULTISPECIES: hypothetical protein [Kitasatospora]
MTDETLGGLVRLDRREKRLTGLRAVRTRIKAEAAGRARRISCDSRR